MPDNRSLADPGRRYDLALAFALTAALFFIIHGYALFDPWIVNDDTRQQLYWMQQWQDPALYQDDWLADYARRYVTWGVRGLYRAASVVVQPLLFSKILSGIEFILLGGALFAIGRLFAGRAGGWGVLCAYWLMPVFMHNISGGLARSFAAPLMALFWISWQKGRDDAAPSPQARWGILVSLLLLGVFIPYIFALCGLALGIAWACGVLRLTRMPPVPRRWWEYVLVAASALPVWLYNKGLAGSGFGPMVDAADMAGNPVFGPMGRFPIVPVPSLPYELLIRPMERILPFRELGTGAGILAAIVLAVLFAAGARRISWRPLREKAAPYLWLLLASLVLWFAARILLLQLFIPSRYLEYTTALGWCVFLGVLAAGVLAPLVRSKAVAALLILLCLGLGGVRLHGEALYDYGDDGSGAELYEAVRETPKDALFAGHPYAMDNVLTFGRRSVLASYELAHPWSKGLWERLRPRFEDMLRAYYAKDSEVVRKFCQRWKIDYIVVDEKHFSRSFMMPSRQLVPVCQAPMPDLAHTLCKAAGLRFPVVVRLGDKPKGAPGDHPMFSPYASLIAAQAQRPGRFALLDDPAFEGRALGSHVRLVDVRGLRTK